MSESPPRQLSTPLTTELVLSLRAGDRILLSGEVYTARDAAHLRLVTLLQRGAPLPFDLAGQVIYYVGPSPARPGQIIGSAGPTTAGRVDTLTPPLLQQGLKGMIGKGKRDSIVRQGLVDYQAAYFVAAGGAAALIAACVLQMEPVAFEDLGTEAIRKLTVRDFPLIVGSDAHGGDLYELGRAQYQRSNRT